MTAHLVTLAPVIALGGLHLFISLGYEFLAIIYIAANIALAVHIFHGAWSMFQTLGINNPRYNGMRKGFARGIAGLILIGNLSFPLAVQGGLIDIDNHTPGSYAIDAEENG